MKKMTLSASALTLGLLTSGLQVASAATLSFVGRTDNATGTFNLTELGDVDWAYWNSALDPATGLPTNDRSGGTSIGSISGTGATTSVRGTSSTGQTVADFTFSNGSATASGTAFNPNGLFNQTIGTAGYGVELDFTLANAGQAYAIHVWTAGFATQQAIVVGTLPGAASYDSGTTSGTGTGSPSSYGDFTNPKEQYFYTFNVIADNDNDVFNFRIRSSGSQGASGHVLINAASIAVIPEPSSLLLLLIALTPLVWLRCRKV